ncbi:hypothetical protein [Legionella sp.]
MNKKIITAVFLDICFIGCLLLGSCLLFADSIDNANQGFVAY